MAINSEESSLNRRTPRRNYHRLVGVLHLGQYYLQRASQISEGGMRIELPINFKSGDLIVVTFVLPLTLESVVGRAEIVHKKTEVKDGRVQTGIKFLNLEAHKRRAIRDFVSSKAANHQELTKSS